MTKITTAMLLAAGLGTRMKPLTDNLPKPLIEVGGRTLVDRVLDKLVAQGVTRAVVNVHYLADMMIAHLRARKDIEIVISDERAVLLETGGGVIQALPLLGKDPFFVINTDVTWATPGDTTFLKMAEAYDPNDMDALLLLADMNATLGFRGPGDFFLGHDGSCSVVATSPTRHMCSPAPTSPAPTSCATTRSSPSPPTSIGTRWAAPVASMARS